MITEKDIISTTELAKRVRAAGIDKPFGDDLISVKTLQKFGYEPFIQLREGVYWSVSIVDDIIKNYQKTETVSLQGENDLDMLIKVFNINIDVLKENFKAIYDQNLGIEKKLNLILLKLENIK